MSGGNPRSRWKTATARAASETFVRIKFSRAIMSAQLTAENTKEITKLRTRATTGIIRPPVAFDRGQFARGRKKLLATAASIERRLG